jgi:hypothetical protein
VCAFCCFPCVRCSHSQEYARLLKATFPTIDAALFRKHLFQMTVSPEHSVNLAGLNAAMAQLGLIGPGGAATHPCTLYFAVPPDIFPIYKHKPGSMVPSGSVLPANVTLAVLEIPTPTATIAASVAAASAAATSVSAGSKRKPEAADLIQPPAKLAASSTRCNCFTGCQKGTCKCFKAGNKCTKQCHTSAAPASAVACANK